jgi:sugar/nucleoside kinase (ribokinase family)
MVVVKRGPAAAICRRSDEQWSLVPPTVKVIDQIGAGDSFAAGFIHKYLQGATPEESLWYGNLAGSYSTTCEGGTEAFRDTVALGSFIQRHELLQGRTTTVGSGR